MRENVIDFKKKKKSFLKSREGRALEGPVDVKAGQCVRERRFETPPCREKKH